MSNSFLLLSSACKENLEKRQIKIIHSNIKVRRFLANSKKPSLFIYTKFLFTVAHYRTKVKQFIKKDKVVKSYSSAINEALLI